MNVAQADGFRGNCSRLRGRVGLQSKFRVWLPLCERPDGPYPHKSCMLNEDFTEVEWVRQTDQVLVIKDRCSARVAAPVPKEPEQLLGRIEPAACKNGPVLHWDFIGGKHGASRNLRRH